MSKKEYSQVNNFIFICTGKKCKSESKALQKAFKHAVEEEDLKKNTRIFKVKCTGRCKEAPVAIIGTEWLGKLNPQDAHQLVKSNLVKNS